MMEKNRTIFILILLSLIILVYIYHGNLFNALAIFDDQRNVLKAFKEFEYNGITDHFYRAPLFFLILFAGSKILSAQIFIKFLFLAIIPIFVYYAFQISYHFMKERKYPFLGSSAVTILVLSFYQFWLMSGHHKSITLPLLMGAFYYVLVDRKILLYSILVITALIYPPHFIIGVGFMLSYQFFDLCLNWISEKQLPAENLKRFGLNYLLPALVVVTLFGGYFAITIQQDIRDFTSPDSEATATAEKVDIPGSVLTEITTTRPDFIPRDNTLMGFFPVLYLNDIRMGLFGLMGGVKLWGILILIIFFMLIILRNNMQFPLFIFALYFTGIFLYLIAHLFYNSVYLPNRYTLFTLPLATSMLMVLNIRPALDRIIQSIRKSPKLFRLVISMGALLISLLLGYFTFVEKAIVLGSEFGLTDKVLILFAMAMLLGVGVTGLVINRGVFSDKNLVNGGVYYFLIPLILYVNLTIGFPDPIQFRDQELIDWTTQINQENRISGYPEEMDTIFALSNNYFTINLGQGRTNRDAVEFYRLLSAYYTDDYQTVYEYMMNFNCDYLVINKEYFQVNGTENNSLFAFYPVLKKHEQTVKSTNQHNFVLENPVNGIVVESTEEHTVISKEQLADYLNANTS